MLYSDTREFDEVYSWLLVYFRFKKEIMLLKFTILSVRACVTVCVFFNISVCFLVSVYFYVSVFVYVYVPVCFSSHYKF